MTLPGFSSDGPNSPKASPGLVGIICGFLFCFLLLVITFLWWGKLFPHLRTFAGWLGKTAKKCFSRKTPPTVVLPMQEASVTESILHPPPPIRHHVGAESVDTLPMYEGPTTLPQYSPPGSG